MFLTRADCDQLIKHNDKFRSYTEGEEDLITLKQLNDSQKVGHYIRCDGSFGPRPEENDVSPYPLLVSARQKDLKLNDIALYDYGWPSDEEFSVEIDNSYPYITRLLDKMNETIVFRNETEKPLSHYICLAGGSISSLLQGMRFPIRRKTEVKDFDFFIVNVPHDDRQFLEKLKDLFVSSINDVIGRVKLEWTVCHGVMTSTHDTDGDYCRCENRISPIQLILRPFPSISSLLHGFDLGSSCYALKDGSSLVTTTFGAVCFQNSMNLVHMPYCSKSYVHRLVKYCQRGYRIMAKGLEHVEIEHSLKMDALDFYVVPIDTSVNSHTFKIYERIRGGSEFDLPERVIPDYMPLFVEKKNNLISELTRVLNQASHKDQKGDQKMKLHRHVAMMDNPSGQDLSRYDMGAYIREGKDKIMEMIKRSSSDKLFRLERRTDHSQLLDLIVSHMELKIGDDLSLSDMNGIVNHINENCWESILKVIESSNIEEVDFWITENVNSQKHHFTTTIHPIHDMTADDFYSLN